MPRSCLQDCTFRWGITQREGQQFKNLHENYWNWIQHSWVRRSTKTYIPRPLDATSVAMRMGALPNLNSVEWKNKTSEQIAPVKYHILKKKKNQGLWNRTIEHPVSLLLAFVSVYTHCRPPATQDSQMLSVQYPHTHSTLLKRNTYPSLRILLVRSSHLLLVSTKMMVLFSFSLMISSSRRSNLEVKEQLINLNSNQ